jgi:hypothetical protein
MSKFVYHQDRRIRGTQRKLLDNALAEAAKGNVKRLATYLRYGFAITEQRHLNALADLIAPPIRKRGRPKGRDPSPRAEAVRRLVALVSKREREWHKKNPNKSFRGFRRKFIREVFAMPGDDGDFGFAVEITEDEVYAALNRGSSSRKIPN